MKINALVLVVLFLVVSILLSGCSTGLMPASWPGITADAETAYVAAGPQVYAVKLSNGSELWRFPEKPSSQKPYFAAPALTPDGQLIVGGFDTVLYSLDPADGAINWTFEGSRDRWIGSVLVANDLIYAPSADYKLYALNLEGELQWTFQAGQALWAAPVSDGERVYLTSLDHQVYALNARTGEKIWAAPLDGAVLGTPALGLDGTLYVGTFGGTMFALDAASGEARWQVPSSGWIWGGAALDADNLYFGCADGEFYSFTLADGRKNWQLQPNGPILGSPLVVGDLVMFGTESGSLYTVDRQGKTNEMTIGGKLYGTPVMAGDLILVAPVEADNILIALDLNGVRQWAFTPAKK